MYRQKLKIGTFFFLICTVLNSLAQISISPSSGCMPNGITNASFSFTGAGVVTNVVWDFGDGTPTSNQNPTQHSYPSQGNYVVTFTALLNGSPVTYTAGTQVHPKPTGSFNFVLPASHCIGMPVTFTGSSPIPNVVYNWDYGNGNLGTGNPSTHAYGTSGIFTPILTVLNPVTQCFDNITSATQVNVSAFPTAIILPSNGISSCTSPFTTSFDGSSSTSGSPISGGGLTYAWSYVPFGSSGSSATGPISFSPQGKYPVVLTVTDNNNCSKTSSVEVKVETPTVTAVVPGTICVNSQLPPLNYPGNPTNIPTSSGPEFTVTVQSSEVSTFWQMGDGNSLAFPKPIPPSLIPPILQPTVPYTGVIHNYATPGVKILTITATSGACIASITRSIMVEAIAPSFTATLPNFTCAPQFLLDYVNQSNVNTNASLSYTWEVGHWDTQGIHTFTIPYATAANFTYMAKQQSLSPYASFSPAYQIPINLWVHSLPTGCLTNTMMVLDSIRRPTASFVNDKTEGCAPFAVSFTSTSQSNEIDFPIMSYTWNFGGSPSNTVSGLSTPPSYTVPSQVFTYTAPGVYYPTLSISTASGCGHTSYQHTITVSNPPSFNYTVPTSVCAGQAVQAHFAPTGTSTVQHWHVQSDNGSLSGCVSDPDPTWIFTNPGIHNYTVTAYQNSCKSTSVLPVSITVGGPMGKASYSTNCSINRKSIVISYKLADVQSATLNFGDNSTPLAITGAVGGTVNGNVTHAYQTAGDYTLVLTSLNNTNGCAPYTYTMVAEIRDVVADFDILTPTVVCTGEYISLTAVNSVDESTVSSRPYTWFVSDLAPFQTPTYNYTFTGYIPTPGLHPIKLRVKDDNGCVAEVTKYIRISRPTPDFSFNKNPICFSDMPAQMLNLTPQNVDSVKSYVWRMGDSVYSANPPFTLNTVITGTTYNHSPTHIFPMGISQIRTFSVILQAIDIHGCEDSTMHVITVSNPVVSAGSAPNACIPLPLVFNIVAAPTNSFYTVNYGNGVVSNPLSYNTASTYVLPYTYTAAGTYTPQVTLTDIAGCMKTATLFPVVIQNNPVSTFTMINFVNGMAGEEHCLPFTLSVTATNPYPGANYYWDLGKGDPTTITSSPFAGATFTSTGSYTVNLSVITVPAGCKTSSSKVISLFDPRINFVIEPDSTKNTYCLGEPITVRVTTNLGLNADTQYFIWDFGNGIVQPKIYQNFLRQAVYTNTFYPELSNGDLTIEATGYAGLNCKESKRKKVKIIRVESDFNRNGESVLSDYAHCLGKQDLFENKSATNSSVALTYTWNYGDGSASTFDINGSTTYSLPGVYTVTLQTLEPKNGCLSESIKTMTVYPSPKASLLSTESTCPGTPFLISGSGTPGTTGSVTGTLSPGNTASPITFDSSNTFTTTTSATVSTTYSLVVKDSNGCESAVATSSIYIQPPAPTVHWDTTVVVGEPAPLNAHAGAGFTYTWTTIDYLRCDSLCLIYNPVSTTTVGYTYTVMVEDSLKCSVVKNTYQVNIRPVVSLDVPTAFTPNGDGKNDVIFPGGWGIRKLIYFKIFNRWGQLVFESNDLNVGWDGTFNGVPQNMETYVYQVSVETYLDLEPTLSKTGTFKLLR